MDHILNTHQAQKAQRAYCIIGSIKTAKIPHDHQILLADVFLEVCSQLPSTSQGSLLSLALKTSAFSENADGPFAQRLRLLVPQKGNGFWQWTRGSTCTNLI